MANIFLSYARGDKSTAIELVRDLESHGKSVWWDPDLIGGTDFRDEIKREIDSADKVVVLWSSLSIDSTFVKDEAERARDLGKLIPVRIGKVEIPIGFGSLHTLDWNDGIEPILAAAGVASGRVELIKRGKTKVSLSKTERLILINQFQILSALEPDNAADYSLTIKKLENGYLDRLFVFDSYLADDLSESIHNDVFEILEMHRALRFGYNQLQDKNCIDQDCLTFRGFDGNNESEYFAYAAYLLNDEKLYQELHNDGGSYNSHLPTLNRYAAMLRRWKQSDDKQSLTKADILRIISC